MKNIPDQKEIVKLVEIKKKPPLFKKLESSVLPT